MWQLVHYLSIIELLYHIGRLFCHHVLKVEELSRHLPHRVLHIVLCQQHTLHQHLQVTGSILG
jgi:hypothetical protein